MHRDEELVTGDDRPPALWDAFGRRPVVLQVLPALATGGVERGTIDVALALAEAGAVPVVASAGGPMVRELDRAGVTHVTLPLASKNPWRMHRNVKVLAELIREYGVDLVHARSRAPAWSACQACRDTGTPFVTTFHAPYAFRSRFKHFYNSVMARGDRVIAISAFIRDYILANYTVAPERIRLIHRGIDPTVFAPERVSSARLIQLAARWRLPEDRAVILLPGRLTRWKGQSVLIDAMARLGRRDVLCLLVGSDQGRTGYRRELEAQIKRLGLEGLVCMTDHCSDMAAAYRLATVVVSASSEPEAFGRVIVEAQAMGKPVIVTGIGACKETMLEGQTGWVVPPSDPDALAAAISAALELGPDQLDAVATRARDFVADRYTKQRMCADTLAVYAELLAERGFVTDSSAPEPAVSR